MLDRDRGSKHSLPYDMAAMEKSKKFQKKKAGNRSGSLDCIAAQLMRSPSMPTGD